MIVVFFEPDSDKLEEQTTVYMGLFFALAAGLAISNFIQFWSFNVVA